MEERKKMTTVDQTVDTAPEAEATDEDTYCRKDGPRGRFRRP